MLFVACTHIRRGRVFALCFTLPHSEEVEQDEDCREYGDVQYVPPRSRQGAQCAIRPPTPRRRIRARHGRVCQRRGESTRGLQIVARRLARRAQPPRELSVALTLYSLECVEGRFSEVELRLHGVLRSSYGGSWANRIGAMSH